MVTVETVINEWGVDPMGEKARQFRAAVDECGGNVATMYSFFCARAKTDAAFDEMIMHNIFAARDNPSVMTQACATALRTALYNLCAVSNEKSVTKNINTFLMAEREVRKRKRLEEKEVVLKSTVSPHVSTGAADRLPGILPSRDWASSASGDHVVLLGDKFTRPWG